MNTEIIEKRKKRNELLEERNRIEHEVIALNQEINFLLYEEWKSKKNDYVNKYYQEFDYDINNITAYVKVNSIEESGNRIWYCGTRLIIQDKGCLIETNVRLFSLEDISSGNANSNDKQYYEITKEIFNNQLRIVLNAI